MKLFLLATSLVGLLQAQVVHRHLDILEGEVTYRQTVTLDYDKNIQIVEVPAHNNIVHSKTIFDFNKGKLFESHPETKTCYVRDIPEDTADLKTFDDFLQKKTVKLVASKEKRIHKAFENSRELNVKMLKSMASEVIEECGQSQIYQVVEVPTDTWKTFVEVKKVSSPEKQMRSPRFETDCNLSDKCMWQTCYYGDGVTDSCYHTVTCRPSASSGGKLECDFYHASNIHNGGHPIHCDSCWNLECGQQCVDTWEDPVCHDVIADVGNMPACPSNPDLGGQCDDVSEPHCYLPNVYYPEAEGEFVCPTQDFAKGIVHLGDMCIYNCPNNQNAGWVICGVDGAGEGKFTEDGYNPESCK